MQARLIATDVTALCAVARDGVVVVRRIYDISMIVPLRRVILRIEAWFYRF